MVGLMAGKRREKRPPLQLQFTVQDGKRVLPLNADNVSVVLKTGVFTKAVQGRAFGQWLDIPLYIRDPHTAAKWWVKDGKDRRWRCIIYWLDMLGETGLADELMPYSEPSSDSSLTLERVTPIFMNMRNWMKLDFIDLVPDARAKVIRHDYKSQQNQRRQGASYYISVHPRASWEHLAGGLYQCKETRAIEAFKAQLPKPKDPSLTVDNMMTATEGVEMPDDYSIPDMPYSTYCSIVEVHGRGDNGKRKIFSEFLSHHPYPRWEVVIDLLESLEWEGSARHGLAQEVKEKYLTSD